MKENKEILTPAHAKQRNKVKERNIEILIIVGYGWSTFENVYTSLNKLKERNATIRTGKRL